MKTHVSDIQQVTGSDSVLFSLIQQAPKGALVTIVNTGTNTMNFHFQEFDGNAWTNMGAFGSTLNNTLSANQIVNVAVVSNYPQVRLMGYASGGATLDFAVDRYVERQSGGVIPILSL